MEENINIEKIDAHVKEINALGTVIEITYNNKPIKQIIL